MEEDFDFIVRTCYNRLREPFERRLKRQYPSLRGDTVDDLYQEAFVAVYDNIQRGRVRQDTNWDAYILTIGMNMASRRMLHSARTNTFGIIADDDGDNSNERLSRKVEDILKEMPEEDTALCNDPEVLSRLGYELEHTPALCSKIIRLFYYADASMEEIAEETGLKNAQTAKAKKSQCMKDLIQRVTDALRRAGFDVTPKRRNPNGKNRTV